MSALEAEQGRLRREEWADRRLDIIKQAETALKEILEHQGAVRGDFIIGQIQADKLPSNTSARTDTLLMAYAILRDMPLLT